MTPPGILGPLGPSILAFIPEPSLGLRHAPSTATSHSAPALQNQRKYQHTAVVNHSSHRDDHHQSSVGRNQEIHHHSMCLTLMACSGMDMIHVESYSKSVGGLVDHQLVTYEVYRIQNAIGAEWHEPPRGMHASYKQNIVQYNPQCILLSLIKELYHPPCPNSCHHYWRDVDILVGAVRNIDSYVFHQCSAPNCSSILFVFCSVSPLCNKSRGSMRP